MRDFRLDDATSDKLLGGNVAPADAPPGFERLASLVHAARGPAAVTELGNEAQVVAAVAAAVRTAPIPHSLDPGKKSMLAKLLSAKVAAVAATMVLGATAAAAATNSLPAPAQTALSNAASHVGVSVPKPNDHGKPADHQPGNGNATGPDATGNAKTGLCQAFASGPSTTNVHDGEANSVAFQNLAKAASDAGMSVADYCSGVTPTSEATDNSGTDNSGKPENTGKPDNAGKPDSAGRSGDHAPVTTPNSGGTGTAGTASGGASDNGTSTAGTASGGASSGGSANAGSHSDAGTSHRP